MCVDSPKAGVDADEFLVKKPSFGHDKENRRSSKLISGGSSGGDNAGQNGKKIMPGSVMHQVLHRPERLSGGFERWGVEMG